MEYLFGAAVGVALFAWFSFRGYRTSNDLTKLIVKQNKYKESLNKKGKTLFGG